MFRRSDNQQTFFGDYLYDRILPEDHFLRRLKAAVDFEFVNAACENLYCEDNGRPCWEPALIFRVLFLQFLHNISDRDIEEQITFNLAFKWFVGLPADGKAPDSTTLSVFRDRLGPKKFQELFNHTVTLARSKGVVSDKLHIIDSTDIKANVDLFRIKKEHGRDDDNFFDPPQPGDGYVDKNSPDPDARFGRKRKDKPFYGYKAHVRIDAESEIITTMKVTPGHASDGAQLPGLMRDGPRPGGVTADKAYDAPINHHYLAKRRIRNGIIPNWERGESHGMRRVSRTARKYRSRIERKFAEAKRYSGLAKARFLGLAKMKIQAFMTAIALNLKKLIHLIHSAGPPPRIKLRYSMG